MRGLGFRMWYDADIFLARPVSFEASKLADESTRLLTISRAGFERSGAIMFIAPDFQW